MNRQSNRRGFTLVELVVILGFLVLILLVPGLMKERWNADGLAQSLNNVRVILAAAGQYRNNNQGRLPMRGCGYSQGLLPGGWDTWSAFGKNNHISWQSSSSAFDESAYSRALNSYLQAQLAPVPPFYTNTGSGVSSNGFPAPGLWTLNHGIPTAQQRASFEVKMCRSPGDVVSYQSGLPFSGRSSYDDVGTSYHLNLMWWTQSGFPSDFTAHFTAGTERIRNLSSDNVSSFVWIADQTTSRIANSTSNFVMKGEFGGPNMSVMGFLDGNAAYRRVTAGAGSGQGYTLLLPP